MRREAPRSAAALITAVFREIVRRLRRVDDRVEREMANEEEGFFSEPWRREMVFRNLPDNDIPNPWKSCFSRIRGCA